MSAVAVEPSVEIRAQCADRAEVAAVFAAVLHGARAPGGSSEAPWQVRAIVSDGEDGRRTVSAEIHDGSEALVASRVLEERTSLGCKVLVRAVGAWAQVVLDDALTRAPPAESPSMPDRAPMGYRIPMAPPPDADTASEFEPPGESARPKGSPRETDLGAMLFLRNGATSNGGLFGIAPFVAFNVAPVWVVRGEAMYGTSTSRVPPSPSSGENVSAAALRLDLCRRLRGNYIYRRGIEFDLCVGSDGARVWSSRDAAWRATAGLSAILRGQIGSAVALDLRPLLGVNLHRARFAPGEEELSPVAFALEVGVSVRFP